MFKFTVFLNIFTILTLSAISCVTSDETTKWDYNYEVAENGGSSSNVDDDKQPLAYVKVLKFISGDTVLLQNNKVVKYAGIECPSEGQAYFETARTFNQQLIGNKMVKIILVKGTKASDATWFGNVLTKMAPLPQGISVPEQLVKNGYAKVVTSKPIEYETIGNNGKKIILTSEQNNLVYNKLLSLQKEAKSKKLGIWSSQYEK